LKDLKIIAQSGSPPACIISEFHFQKGISFLRLIKLILSDYGLKVFNSEKSNLVKATKIE